MDTTRSWAPGHWLLAWSALCVASSVAAWYGCTFYDAQAPWMVFAWVMVVLAAGFAAVWLLTSGKRHGELSRRRILFLMWFGLVTGWAAYLLIANERNGPTFEPWILVGCVAVMLLSWTVPVLAKLVRARPRKQ